MASFPAGFNFDILRASNPEWDLLLSAARKGETESIRRMVEKEGVPVSHGNAMGQTALHIAVMWGHVESTTTLIELGAEVNKPNMVFGATSLHTVLQSTKLSEEVKYQIAKILSEAGADMGLEDRNGKVPFHYIPMGHPKVTELRRMLKPPPRSREQLLKTFVADFQAEQPFCRVAKK